MTDRQRTDAPQPASPPRRSPSATGEPARGAQSVARARKAHPLLGAFPLAVMTLATFLVLFTLMMARLQAGADPALHASSGTLLVSKRSGGSMVSTRTSGGVAGAGATPAAGAGSTLAAATEGSGATTPAIVTRASGAGAKEGVDD